jgi:23S rRNA (uracil1939-C5)-methyltransferase
MPYFCPVRKKNQALLLEKIEVEDYAAEGKSLARSEGKVIFIEGAVPGDIVDVRLKKNKKDWAEGAAVRIHQYSRDRVTPFCSHFGVCGGCQWQMLPYSKQLHYKEIQVAETLKRIGKISLPGIEPIKGAELTKYYRNKLEFTFGNKKYLLPEELGDPLISPEEDVLGFHVRGFFDKIIDINTCYLQPEPSNAIRLTAKRFAREKKYSFYDIRNHRGLMRTMQIRTTTTGEVMVNMVFGEDEPGKIRPLMQHLLEQFPEITTLLYTINSKWNDSLQDLQPVIFSGKGYVIEKLEDFRFKIGPLSFFQTNSRQGELLYQVTREFAELTGEENIYDLYCGTGSIGIFLSKAAKKIVGVELIDAAVEDARENARLNQLSDALFFSGDVIHICDEDFFTVHGKPDVIITDPPRAGMHEKLVRKILEISAPTVVYVSCNPSTQARDLAALDEKYQVTRIQPVDMFPHTHHIENVVQLKLRQ